MPWGTPKGWVEPEDGALNRCAVIGFFRSGDGRRAGRTITFTPGRGGEWKGEFVAATRIEVNVDGDGRFRVLLVPSEAVGIYTVRMGDAKVLIDVPDKPTADLTSIIWKEDGLG